MGTRRSGMSCVAKVLGNENRVKTPSTTVSVPRSGLVLTIKTEGRRFSSVFPTDFCDSLLYHLLSVSRRLGNGRRCRASWRVVRLQQDVAADSRAVVGSAACSTASLWQRRVIRVALCPSHGWRQVGSLRHLQNSSSSGMAINARHRGRVAAKDRVGSSARCPSGAWIRRACWRPWRRTTLQRQPIIWTMMSGTRRRTSGWSSGAAACSSTAFFSTDAPCSAVLRWWLLRGNAVRGKQGLQQSNKLGALPTRWRARGDGKCCAPNPSTVVQTPRQR